MWLKMNIALLILRNKQSTVLRIKVSWYWSNSSGKDSVTKQEVTARMNKKSIVKIIIPVCVILLLQGYGLLRMLISMENPIIAKKVQTLIQMMKFSHWRYHHLI